MREESIGKGVHGVVEEVMRIYRSLPCRPTIEEVEAAMALVRAAEKKEEAKIDEILKQQKPAEDVPDELFSVLKEMQKNLVLMQSREEKKEALAVLDLEKWYKVFDGLLERASDLVSGKNDGEKEREHKKTQAVAGYPNGIKGLEDSGKFFMGSRDDSVLDKPEKLGSETETLESHREVTLARFQRGKVSQDVVLKTQRAASFGKSYTDTGYYEGKLSLIKLANLIEATAKKGSEILDLEEKLIDQVEWLPDSLGKLTSLVELNLSNNRIVTLPNSIGGLSGLTKLDLHSNQLYSLPETIGQLSCLIDLDLHANLLRSLPSSIGDLSSLVRIDMSSNQITSLPDSIGNLSKLKELNIETNEIEELPYTIGNCTSLTVLRADFNKLKALPEAVGKLTGLEVLTFHYNKVRSLPTTMAHLENLKELDASFNELESIPESLCFATNLTKLNVGRNFADLHSLPRSIGNLEMLEELDISSNQIKVLPDSFANLKNLKVLKVEEVPLEVPPIRIAQLGAQAVVNYMTELISHKDEQTIGKKKKSWHVKFFSCLMFWKNSHRKTQQAV